MAEITIGTVAGSLSFLNNLFGDSGDTVYSSTTSQYAFLSLQLADTVTSGTDSLMRNFIQSRFALTIP